MPWAADVDPRAGGHLAVHHQALAIELVEMLPGRPARHQVGVGDQHARRVRVGAEHADRLARLDQQGLVVLQPARASRRSGRSSPSRGRRGRSRRRRPAPPAARRPPGRGCSSACAAAPRSASSWRVSVAPRGRGSCGSGRSGSWAGPPDGRSRAHGPLAAGEREARLQDAGRTSRRRGRRGVVLRRPVRLARRVGRLGEVAAAGQLHLDGVDTVARPAVMPGDEAAPEAPIGHAG